MKKQNSALALTLLIILYLATGCGPSPEQIREDNIKKYKEHLETFKQDSLELLRSKYELFISFQRDFYEITTIPTPALHKDLKIRMGSGDYKGEDFNTFYLSHDYYLDPENNKFPMPHYKHLNNISRLIKGQDLVWEERGEKYSITEFRKFRAFCRNFAGAEYIAIERDLEIKKPDTETLIKQGKSEVFIPGTTRVYLPSFASILKSNCWMPLCLKRPMTNRWNSSPVMA